MIDPPALPRRLVAALPRAWATDRTFRFAAIGAAAALVMLLGRLVDGDGATPPVAPDTEAAAPPPGARYAPATSRPAVPEAPSGPLAPGRGLDGVTIERDPNAPRDAFGTLRAADPPPASHPTPPRKAP